MMNKIKIRTKLILYSFIIQLSILLLFSTALYKTYENSLIKNIENTLDIILLDISHDLSKNDILSLEKKAKGKEDDLFDEDKEFNFDPLNLRFIKIEGNKLRVLKHTNFPNKIFPKYEEIKNLEVEEPIFKIIENHMYQLVKLKIDGEYFLLEALTDKNRLTRQLDELLFALFLIIPIILIIGSLGHYFLIYKSFEPIKELLGNLKTIQANSLSKRLKRTNNKDEIDLLNKEINSLLSRLEDSFEKISQFSSNASHELKTPLTIIRGEIELALRKDRETNEYKQTLENCQSEVLTIQQTVEHLLFLAKSKDYLENNIEDIYMDEIALECVNELKSYAKLKNIYLDPKITNISNIKGNKELLKVAIKNIIKNAISFSFEKRTIQIRTNETKDTFTISIKDSGIGIKKEEQEKIFEEFYRTDKSRSKESGGTGLGLTISKKIISMHEGEIKLDSEENIGTEVKLIFKK